jgi:hypothetical protein
MYQNLDKFCLTFFIFVDRKYNLPVSVNNRED